MKDKKSFMWNHVQSVHGKCSSIQGQALRILAYMIFLVKFLVNLVWLNMFMITLLKAQIIIMIMA